MIDTADMSSVLSRAVLDTPDDVHQMLSRAGWEPREGGWRDPDDGTVVRWGETLRRARRRVRVCSCGKHAGEGHALACELAWGSAEGRDAR